MIRAIPAPGVNHPAGRRHLSGVVTVTLEARFGASLVERAAHGDETAFARLVAEFHADMMRVAYVTCGDPELAQDAVQAAWTIAWRKLGSVRDPERVKGWLVSVAANEARQLVRRRHRHPVVELKVDEVALRSDDPGDLIERVDLVIALGHLKPEDRMLLALRYVGGMDSFELGEQLHMSPSGTRARLARLLTRLRRDLDDG
jgi:RNA polymerase sigma-70 factor (ECF subfamily)